jgi:hypothetical protein
MKAWRKEARQRNLAASLAEGKRIRHQGRLHKLPDGFNGASPTYPLLLKLFLRAGLLEVESL